MASYTVQSGDCFSSLAKKNGFNHFSTIYKKGTNKADWPNPNTLEPGKAIELPTLAPKIIKKAHDALHKFVVIQSPTALRLAFVDVEMKPLSLKAQTLTMGGAPVLKSNAGGKVDYKIDPTVETATILVELAPAPPAAPTPASAPAPAPDPNAYPPTVKAAEYEDKLPDAPPAVQSIDWHLTLGALQPKNVSAGTLQRLINLGRALDGGSSGDTVKAAVKQWQRNKKQTETGDVADIADDVATAHDRP